MQNLRRRVISVLAAVVFCCLAVQGSFLPITNREHIDRSGAVFRGLVVQLQCFERQGSLWTTAQVRVEESFKGKLPTFVDVVVAGGRLGDRAERNCSSPVLTQGLDAIFYVTRDHSSGELRLTRGSESAVGIQGRPEASGLLRDLRAASGGQPIKGEDYTASASLLTDTTPVALLTTPQFSATNLLTTGRFIAPDAGRKIPYLIDCDYLPAGISVTQALWAVATAFNAWTNVSSARFEFAGVQSFGASAKTLNNSGGLLRIQLHDIYNALSPSGELGEGGQTWRIQNSPSGWTSGGSVAGNDFDRALGGYIVLKHTNAVMSTLTTFTEVLAHEIGHTLGLGHSSQANPEPNSNLREAIMYYAVHNDGRGAALNSWDASVCKQAHPFDTPPACLSRFIDVVTTPTIPINIPGVNMVRVPGYDLQGSTVSFQMADATSMNGTFSLTASNVTYVPKAFYSDAPRFDPSTTNRYDFAFMRCSDGLNYSPWAEVGVVSFNHDSYNEGIPDWWRQSWFGSKAPSASTLSRANDDPDGDGYSNIQEWWMDSNPLDATSNLRISSLSTTNLVFEGRAYDVYEVLRSTNMTTWTREPAAAVAQDFVGSYEIDPGQSAKNFFKLRRVP